MKGPTIHVTHFRRMIYSPGFSSNVCFEACFPLYRIDLCVFVEVFKVVPPTCVNNLLLNEEILNRLYANVGTNMC